jgi:hypothetical protein
MWRSVQSPPLLHATFGSIAVKSCHRRRLVPGGGTVRQPQNCMVLRNPWGASGFPPMGLENKFEAKIPCRERIASAFGVLSKQSLSEDTVGIPRACRPSTKRAVFRCTLPRRHISNQLAATVTWVSLNVPMGICCNLVNRLSSRCHTHVTSIF